MVVNCVFGGKNSVFRSGHEGAYRIAYQTNQQFNEFSNQLITVGASSACDLKVLSLTINDSEA